MYQFKICVLYAGNHMIKLLLAANKQLKLLNGLIIDSWSQLFDTGTHNSKDIFEFLIHRSQIEFVLRPPYGFCSFVHHDDAWQLVRYQMPLYINCLWSWRFSMIM